MATFNLKRIGVEIAPFLASEGELVLLLRDQQGRVLTRVAVAPFWVQFPTAGAGPTGPFHSDFAPLWTHAPPFWPYGVHEAPWPSIVYRRGSVLVAVDKEGRWMGECDVPPGSAHQRRAYLALWELLTTGDAVKAERIAYGPLDQRGSVFDPAVVVLLTRPLTDIKENSSKPRCTP